MQPIVILALVGLGLQLEATAQQEVRSADPAEQAVSVIHELRTGPIRYAVVVGNLTEEQFTAMAVQVLSPVDVKFGRVVAYVSRDAELVIEKESELDECSWGRLSASAAANGVRIAPGNCPAVSEAIKIGSGLILRAVDSKCRANRKVLLGDADPLSVDVGSRRAEIIAVSLRPARNGEPPFVNVFVRGKSPLSTGLAEAILARLKSVSTAQEMLVTVRTDSDFVAHCSFPAPYLFDGPASVGRLEAKPPHPGEEVTCSALDPWPVKCWSYGAK